jgi:hypothetical protein
VYALLLRGQRAVPRLPPRLLTLAFRLLRRPRLVRRAFTWYLEQAHPRVAAPPSAAAPATVPAALP